MSDAHDLHRRILLECGNGETRLFRNNTGLGWVGRQIRQGDGSILIQHPRPLHAGLCLGSSDLIGWKRHVVTSEDIGRVLAIFVAIEAKFGSGRLSEAQKQFIRVVQTSGGIAGVARSTEEAQHILEGLHAR